MKFLGGGKGAVVDDELIGRLELAYRQWHDSKGDPAAWADLLADRFAIRNVGDEGKGLDFARERKSRQEALEYMGAITGAWSMDYFQPKTFVRDGSQVAMFGSCKWRNKATGKSAECLISHFWRFEGGKAVELVEIFDSARTVAAATPDA